MSADCSVTPLPLEVGDRLLLAHGRRPGNWWTVQATSPHFVACVRQAAFRPRGELEYTVLDWRQGLRGPCDLVGNGYGDGSYSAEECERMLLQFEHDPEQDPAALEAKRLGHDSWVPTLWSLEVSHRQQVDLRVIDVRRQAAASPRVGP